MSDSKLTIKQVAAELQTNARTVHQWIQRGELKAYRYGSAGRIIRIDRADLNKFRRPVTPLAAAKAGEIR